MTGLPTTETNYNITELLPWIINNTTFIITAIIVIFVYTCHLE